MQGVYGVIGPGGYNRMIAQTEMRLPSFVKTEADVAELEQFCIALIDAARQVWEKEKR